MTDTFTKDPEAVLDYKFDWSAWLGDDTISASTWLADTGITIDDNTQFDDTETVVWLSGGTVGQKYTVTNHITTAAGREDDRKMFVKVKDK